MSLLELVDPLIGTDSHHGFSTGNCLPLCTVPFGMTAWSPQTAEGSWFFDRRQRKLQGIRATHQPSPWIGDYGHFVVMPQIGELHLSPSKRSSAFRLEKSTVKPHHLKFELLRYRTTVELAPTKRCAHLRVSFPEGEIGRIIVEPCAGNGAFEVCSGENSVCGYTSGNSGGCPENFACYYYVTFSRPIKQFGAFSGEVVKPNESGIDGNRAGGYVEFSEDASQVEVKIGTSFISVHQAHRNLARELGNASFDETLERAERVWLESLSRISVEDNDAVAKSIFYTCLYRCHLFPRFWDEEDGDGKVIHFSPYAGEVREGPLVTDNGFWDTYRTIYPLFALLIPERLAHIMQGWVNALKEGGWFPQWASPGYRACMVGTHIDVVVADAISRGVTDFDVKAALDGMLKHADEPGDEAGNYGRIGIEDYKELGYVAADRHDSSVARSLDYAYDDFCIAQVAHHCGRTDVADRLLERAKYYANLWEPSTGFMRARTADGKFAEPFGEFMWGDPYVEGGAWQSTWAVPHDVSGLIDLFGGRERFIAKLTQMLAMPPHFEVNSYGFEIHEMTEMASADFGQYAHSNQPVHHVLYLFAAAGYPWKTQHWVRKVMDELYTPSMFPGDEDNGEMSAWYVLNALGLFPLTPGNGTWMLGAPRFDSVTLKNDLDRSFQIKAVKNSSKSAYVSKVEIDGVEEQSLWISHARLKHGTQIRAYLHDAPKEEPITDPTKLPPSLSGTKPSP
jgi:predicted alpha-1,2-mannosidase